MKKRQNADVRKPQIIKAFYETIIEEGFEGASIAKVAKRINMNPTLILHYFGNKENMTLECVNYTVDTYARLIQKYRSKAKDPEERLLTLVNTLWSREYYEKVHIAATFSVISISFRNTRVKQKIEELYMLFKGSLISELKVLSSAGVISVADLESAADVLISMVEGARHFSHFFIHPDDRDSYHQNMKRAALGFLKNNPEKYNEVIP